MIGNGVTHIVDEVCGSYSPFCVCNGVGAPGHRKDNRLDVLALIEYRIRRCMRTALCSAMRLPSAQREPEVPSLIRAPTSKR